MKHPFFKKNEEKKNAPFPQTYLLGFWKRNIRVLNSIEEDGCFIFSYLPTSKADRSFRIPV